MEIAPEMLFLVCRAFLKKRLLFGRFISYNHF